MVLFQTAAQAAPEPEPWVIDPGESMPQLPNIQTFLSKLSTALTMVNQIEPMLEPMYLGDERFQRWPSPTRNSGLYLEFSLQILNNRDNTPFAITMPSELYLHIKKIQKFRDATPDVDLADMSGDNFMDGDFPWPDFRDVRKPPISENQLDSIGYNIDLTDSELTGPILGPALDDEDFLVQKLDLEHKRTSEEPFENIPMGLYEHKFFDGRRQSYDTAMRAGEGMQIPKWTHKGFDAPVDDEDIASLDRQQVRKALRDYDMTYRANYLNSAFRPEAKSVPPPTPGAMTNWYRKGPVGRGPKPPPKVRRDVADRIAEDYKWLLQEVTPAKRNGDVGMSGVSKSDGLRTDGMEDTLVRRIANDAPGSSEYITGAGLGVVSTNTPNTAESDAPGPFGYNFGAAGRRGMISTAEPAGYSLGSISRDTVGVRENDGRNNLNGSQRLFPEYEYTSSPTTYLSGVPSNINTHTISKVQSRGFDHQNTFTTEAAGEGILQTPSMARDYGIENLVTPKNVTKKGASRDSKDGDWEPEKKQKATKRSTTRKAATAKTATPKAAAPKPATPRAKKTKELTSSSATTPNLIKSAATPSAKPPKTAGRRSATPKTATPKSAVPKNVAAMSGTPKASTSKAGASKAKPPAAAITSNPNLIPKNPTPKKSASGESADGSWEPDDDDMYDA
ncbi:hypothetical protein OCU04_010602 [Sclerotinia nivalis]|uniref:Uncharacterized protein n=1 Tax=Sclerotinia nivalis TaxID=352851 RepID=A0A9X0ACD1_9HELO|nr:hypothetical protein OCU04_010602 [Sclerotinia nivalis]